MSKTCYNMTVEHNKYTARKPNAVNLLTTTILPLAKGKVTPAEITWLHGSMKQETNGALVRTFCVAG